MKLNGPVFVRVKICASADTTLPIVKALLETVTASPSLSVTEVLLGRDEIVISPRLSLPSVSASVAVAENFLSKSVESETTTLLKLL